MIKLCVFDLDGTILDTLPSISYFGNEALKKYGFSEVLYSKYRYFVGDGAKMLIKRMIEDVGGNEEDYNNVYNEYMQTYTKNSTYLTKIYDGIDTMLEKIKELGVKSVILTNKPQKQAENVLKETVKEGSFEKIYGGKENVPLKPDPTVLLNIINEYKVKKDEVLFIGDTKTDLETANNGGVKSIGVLWGFRDEEELKKYNATYIVKTPDEITDIIKTNI